MASGRPANCDGQKPNVNENFCHTGLCII